MYIRAKSLTIIQILFKFTAKKLEKLKRISEWQFYVATHIKVYKRQLCFSKLCLMDWIPWSIFCHCSIWTPLQSKQEILLSCYLLILLPHIAVTISEIHHTTNAEHHRTSKHSQLRFYVFI